jgi:hypothetical protein
METPDGNWQKTPCQGERVAIEHTPIYPLGDCLRLLKAQRDALPPAADRLSYNLSLLILACAFLESSISRGLVHAANHILFKDPASEPLEAVRTAIESVKADLQSGDTFGDPFVLKRNRPSYSQAIKAILGLSTDDRQIFSPDLTECVRTLFRLRNMIVHGQTFVASGIFPSNPSDPVSGYEAADDSKQKSVEAYLAKVGLWQSQQLDANLAFPYASSATVDHLLRGAVDFLRSLRDAIGDEGLRYDFAACCPQYLFPILAGERIAI